MSKQPLYLSAALTFDALQSGDNLPKKFNGIAYSGGAVNDWGEQIVIDLASTLTAPSMPLLFQHDHSCVIGAIPTAINDGSSLSVSGELFSDIDETALAIAKKAQRGACYQMSVGIFDFSRETIPAGKNITVNGCEFTSPVTVLRNGNIREVSIVALGADANTNATFFNKDANKENKQTRKELSMTEEEIKQMQSENATLKEQLASKTAEAEAALAELSAKAAEARTAEIKSLFSAIGEDYSDEKGIPFISMTNEQFSATAETMKKLAANKPNLNTALFSQTVVSGKEDTTNTTSSKLSPSDHYALRKKLEQGA